ncbi:MAG: ATPase, T2SS/T4P/T4SS family [Candidatus Micrarchaeota archaeon]|nr:ATPase, T2SS/T4P/T4SS family [Candidatus Micrarchaeota archaeon]
MGEPRCVSSCPENAISIESKPFVGWRILDSAPQYSVGLPQLTGDEDELVKRAVSEFRELSKHRKIEKRRDVEQAFGEIIKNYSREGLVIEKDQYSYLVRVCALYASGFGAIEPMLSDDLLEEIAVIELDKPIYVYKRSEGWLRTDVSFTRGDAFIEVVNKMARQLGRRITFQSPTINAVLPDGSRLHASIPPVSNFEMTIRKFRSNPISVAELVSFGTFSARAVSFLWLSILADMSILVCGNTASGKTSTLNALFSFVPQTERVVIIEETPEINIPHPHAVRMVSNKELGIGLDSLVHDSLRMRPDRVIVGEARTPEETRALFESLVSGQARSTYATFHARSVGEAVSRIKSMGVGVQDVFSIDLMVVQKRISGGLGKGELRRVTELAYCNEGAFVPAFEYDGAEDSLKQAKGIELFEDGLCRRLSLTKKELRSELAGRSSFLSSLARNPPPFFKALSAISNYGGKS